MALHVQIVDGANTPIKATKVSVFGSSVIGGGQTIETDERGCAILGNAIRGKTTLIVGPDRLEIVEKFDYREGLINVIKVIGNTLILVRENLELCNA